MGDSRGTWRHSVTPARPSTWFVNDSDSKACWTRRLQPMLTASQTNDHVEIRFRQRPGDSFCIARGMNRQIGIRNDVSPRKATNEPIFLCASFYLISVTKLWDMIIRLCMCNSRVVHGNVLQFKSYWLTTNECDMVLLVTFKSDNLNRIRDETHQLNLSQWRHTSHWWGCQCTTRTRMNDNCHAAYDKAANCITLCTDPVHMVEIL